MTRSDLFVSHPAPLSPNDPALTIVPGNRGNLSIDVNTQNGPQVNGPFGST
jgi:hypothetical protein